MLGWAANNGKAIRQRTVRQETTKFKAGTLPRNLYATSAQSTEKMIIERVEEDYHEDSEHDEEQESEHDTESESELLPTVDSDQGDEMTFLRGVTMSIWSLLCSSLQMLFSVNCETRKLSNYRDS